MYENEVSKAEQIIPFSKAIHEQTIMRGYISMMLHLKYYGTNQMYIWIF